MGAVVSGGAVVVWGFGTEDGAREALELLEERWAAGGPALCDAVVVRWPSSGRRAVVRRPGRVVGDAVLGGAAWGVLLGLVVPGPLLGVVVGAGVGAGVGGLVALLTRPGIPVGAVDEVRRRVVPGTSALVLLPADAADRLSRASGAEPGRHP
ncbi:DUF1269 domain-containing protein [Saccharothrix syringae]|uniref:DUF1269 domain-containing protein n=1 Tax=Saccharothrix syringae TaxID=103733 RepID=A0A5Q0H0F6_SACSY|nr:DUF1269 domain-containing protein [Saccharothrix syringae]QFZ19649.1 DUF1269 domain-containing protein [Saccharothrix syringae]